MKNKILFAVFAVFLFLITVFAASAQTIITSEPPTTAVVGRLYTYQMTTNTTGVTYGIQTAPPGFGVNMDTGVYTWNPIEPGRFTVTLIASTNTTNSYQQQFSINVTSTVPVESGFIEITEIEVQVNGDREDTLNSPGTIDYDAELDDEITLVVTVENKFSTRNDDTEFRTVDLEISSNDLDDADGLDDSVTRLEANEDDELTVSFTLDPENVDPSDAPFDIEVDVEAELDDGTIYRDSWTIRLDMETKARDLHMSDVEVSPVSVSSCNENRIRVDMDLRNIGTRDLDTAAVRMRISDMGITKFVDEIELDSGDSDSFSDYLTIPRGVAAGTYMLEIDAFPQRSSSTVTSETAYLITVSSCSTPTNTSTGGTGTGNIPSTGTNGGTVIIPDVTISGTPVSSAVGKKGLFDSENALYLVLLIVLVALLVTVIILVSTKLRND